ncbi:MAG: class I SAM-dependent rRNA methyltransferase, partial [Deltaproteobacteria bacterium]|nr:class I SAM-dependent rRNA methyltransferase [Deltaproteobacteria bacterium]
MEPNATVRVVLKKGREKPVRMGHPWIFSGAIERVHGHPQAGDSCQVVTAEGSHLGYGYYNAQSVISVRMLSTSNTAFDADALRRRIRHALSLRHNLVSNETDSCRLINSEGDFLPGLIVDKVGAGLVLQILTYGMERFREVIVESLASCCSPEFIFERSDSDARKKEGLPKKEGVILGTVAEQIDIKENGLTYVVDVTSGQKTGYFFDQRQNRKLLRSFVEGKSVCDCFSYSGGFATNALGGGASHVDVVDIKSNAIAWAKENVSRNFPSDHRADFVCADIFKYLRDAPQKWDCIICDPPKFAKHANEVKRAARGYKDINLCALKKLNKSGVLFTFSCSQAVDVRLFRQIVFAAAADSGRQVQLLHSLTAGSDHPINIAHMEGEYL